MSMETVWRSMFISCYNFNSYCVGVCVHIHTQNEEIVNFPLSFVQLFLNWKNSRVEIGIILSCSLCYLWSSSQNGHIPHYLMCSPDISGCCTRKQGYCIWALMYVHMCIYTGFLTIEEQQLKDWSRDASVYFVY